MAEKKIPFDQQKYNKNKSRRPRNKWRILKITILAFFLIVLAGGGAAASVIVNWVNDAPPLDSERLETVETSYLYDSEGNEITELHDEQNRVAVSLEDIPEHVQKAFIAIEDERFYDHFGFDVTGSIRAAYANFTAGRIVQGASTISQQLAQNAFLTTETSYERKVQEIWLAIQLERAFSKEEILEMYLNRIYFGNGAYGVEAASHTYFDKSVGEINLPEAAMLAGAVRSPNYYNPINNVAEAESRMRTVLSNMKRLEYISEAEYREAAEQEMSYAQADSPEYPYPYFVDYVIHRELLQILSEIPTIGSREEAYRAIYTGGLRVHTTLDTSIQSHVEDVLNQSELYPTTIKIDMQKAREAIASLPSGATLSQAQLEELIDEEKGIAQPQAAMVLADPNTGQIMALGGGREYRKDEDEVLRFATLRQPGSAIKPVTAYGPAFEEGVLAGAGSTLDDAPYYVEELNWYPENFDYKFRGMTPARESLFKSYNIPAVRTFEKLGPEIGAEYAEKMGISTIHPDEVNNLALTLGGFTRGVSAIDMAQAYSVFANSGLKVNLHTVKKIEDRHGETIYENNVEPNQVLSEEASFLVNDILQDYVTQYIGRALDIDRQVAAKTGTTDDWKDAYLMAYTPNLVASFWMGYDEPQLGGIREGWRFSTSIMREVFLEKFETLEVEEFEQPEGIVRMQVCKRSGKIPNSYCEDDDAVISDYFIEGQEPTESCNMHKDRRTYSRPDYIETDNRWSGGSGRVPLDVEDTDLRVSRLEERDQQSGSTTEEITRFDAHVFTDGITLQWDYDGPENLEAFEIVRESHDDPDDGAIIELDGNARQYSDDEIELDSEYTYALIALYDNGEVSDRAEVRVSTETTEDGELAGQPRDGEAVVVPDVSGSFEAIARSKLEREGLVVGSVDQEHSDEASLNRVISQRPEPGTTLSPGDRVNLVVSKGPE